MTRKPRVPTYVSATSFTLSGDQTLTYTVGRRLKFTVTAGTVYGRILSSVFGALTTVTVIMDGTQVLVRRYPSMHPYARVGGLKLLDDCGDDGEGRVAGHAATDSAA